MNILYNALLSVTVEWLTFEWLKNCAAFRNEAVNAFSWKIQISIDKLSLRFFM